MKKIKQYKTKKHTGKSFKFKEETNRAELYDKEWTRYRFRFLHHNPKCYVCGQKSNVVDHIVAHKGDIELFKNSTNHMPLCKKHHDIITAKFDRYSQPRTEEKMNWVSTQRMLHQVAIKIKVIPYTK